MNKDNMKLPAPTQEELHYTKKGDYMTRMFKEECDKSGLSGGDFSDFASRTFNQYYLNGKHITYRESFKYI